ncbi:hypothetical protein IP91_04234 [Pseudoduganella lurida]|uniref:Uncharacterized protein n=1 Tax=Pseudoduganella lurida TaxID=1036180 RepID=A0A562QZ87_9BURK|nr:hypothetical protein [Pseudoduganella lurida]TWI62125.1 hypothetical protein IP91_04234 [Pseudoduganella lurida]
MLWTTINILVPVLLPYVMILLIALDQIVHDRPGIGAATWRSLLKNPSIRDSCSGPPFQCLLPSPTMQSMHGTDIPRHDFIGLICGLCLLGGFVCTVLVGFSTLRTTTGGNTNWYVIGTSIAITGMLCVFYPMIHFWLQ